MAGTAAAVPERRWCSGSLFFHRKIPVLRGCRCPVFERMVSFLYRLKQWLAANKTHCIKNEAPILTRWGAYATI